MKKLLRLGLYLFFGLLAGMFVASKPVYALPQGFEKIQVATNFSSPTAIAQAPDGTGRIFVLEKAGVVKIVKNGTVLATPFLNISSNVQSDGGEWGLLGIAFDPAFTTSHYVYFYYVSKNPLQIRVSRFTANGDTADPTSELVLIHSTQTLNTMHHAGTLRFGPDGKLWVSVGNNSINTNSQDVSVGNIHGKILRINSDGTIPTDNPFYGQSGKEQSIWAYGFRNPFRFNFLPDGRPIVGDVGEATWEEVNVIVKGGNYGWPNAEGACEQYGCPYIDPIFQYNHNNGSAAVTGGFVYTASASYTNPLPSSYNNSYFYGDYANGFIHRIQFDSAYNFVSDQPFDASSGTVVDFLPAGDGSFYYLTIYPGTLFHVIYSTANIAPTAVITASPSAGLTPLQVSFSGSGSQDASGQPLTYSWDFGDGATGSGVQTTHTYTTNADFTAKLTVSNGITTGSATTIIHAGKQAPSVTITSPTSAKYNAGDVISYAATATDPHDGTLPASAYNWKVVFHHQTHIHPFLDSIPGVESGTFTIPATGETSTDVWYEISVTVTNSFGISTTAVEEIHPNITTLSFASDPSGLQMTLDGIPHTTPFTTDSVVGMNRALDTSSPQSLNGLNYYFDSWSDNGGKTHQIVTPATATTYTAHFTGIAPGSGSIRFRVRQFDQNGNFTGKYVNGVTALLTDPEDTTVVKQTTSQTVGSEDGWVFFDNIDTGRYATITYKEGFVGIWKQTTCDGAGTTSGSTIQNSSTNWFTGAWNNQMTVSPNQITWCSDLGLYPQTTGGLQFRVREVVRDFNQPLTYAVSGSINDATVKLTDTNGNTVYQTTKSQSVGTDDGWALMDNILAGNYGVMAYKAGYSGVWRITDCQGTQHTGSITNQNTDGMQAAWNSPVSITAGKNTYCYDLGLIGNGYLLFRVREFDASGNFTGKYINGATVKLTDPTGKIVVATSTSKTVNNQDGWVVFNNVPDGGYGVMTYMSGYNGYWKQTDCTTGGSTTGATIQNTTSESQLAAWQQPITIQKDQTVWCKDVGLQKIGLKTGSVYYRVRQVDQNGVPTGTYINGATAKLTDAAGTTVIATATAKTVNNQDGWVLFDNVPVSSSAGIMTYKSGYTGVWKQINCNGLGTMQNATIQNGNTEGTTAVWQEPVTITENQATWCEDVGLKASPNAEPSPRPGPTLTGTPNPLPSPRVVTPTASIIATPNPLPSVRPSGVASISATPNPLPMPRLSPSAPSAAVNTTAHTIGIRTLNGKEQLYDRLTNTAFVPRGNNYITLDTAGNMSFYDLSQTENTFTKMESYGYNTVRIWVPSNLIGNPSGTGLQDDIVSNIVTVLSLAKKHNLKVVLTIGLPVKGGYYPQTVSPAGYVFDTNWLYLTQQGLDARKKYLTDLLTGFKAHNAPFDTILMYDLTGEVGFISGSFPLNISSGMTATKDGNFDLGNASDRERMMDINLVDYLDQQVDLLHTLDQTALTSVQFQPNAENQSGGQVIFRDLWPIETPNQTDAHGRHGSKVDVVALSLYPQYASMTSMMNSLGVSPSSITKPIMTLEMGYTNQYVTTQILSPNDQVATLLNWMKESCSYGVSGWMFYTWDTSVTAASGNYVRAVDNTDAIAKGISPQVVTDVCNYTGQSATPTPTVTPNPLPNSRSSMTASPSATITPEATPSASLTPTPATSSATLTPTPTVSPAVTIPVIPTIMLTVTPVPSPTPTTAILETVTPAPQPFPRVTSVQ